MSQTAKSMISDLYEEERDAALRNYYDSKQQAFSIRIDARTAAILEGIAKRFGKSRNSIVADLLRLDAETMWDELEQKDRFLVAEHGDSILQKVDSENATLLTPQERKKLLMQEKKPDYQAIAEVEQEIEDQIEEEGIKKAMDEMGMN